MKTLEELKNYLVTNCYNTSHYSILNEIITEGFGVIVSGNLYIWYYIENNNRTNLEYFESEEKIVEFAYEIITKDKYASSNLLLSLFDDNQKLQKIISELEANDIKFWIEEIKQIGLYSKMFRVFIVGCDIKRVQCIGGTLIFK